MKLTLIILTALILSGCSYFRYYDRYTECNELLERSEIQIEQAIVLLDSLVAVTDSLELELIKCQQSKILRSRVRNF